MGGSGWRGWYGKADAVDRQTFVEWREEERERMRGVMRRRRAMLRSSRNVEEPAYPEPVLTFMTRWIEAHRGDPGLAEMPLAQAVFYMRKFGRLELGQDYDLIQARGTAKYLRALGFKLKRAADGMVVVGLRYRLTSRDDERRMTVEQSNEQ